MGRCSRCWFRSRDEWVKQLTGFTGTIVLWISIGSILMSSVYRAECIADASVVPMLLLPTGIMGVFTSAFIVVYITFLWNDDTYDAMKTFTYFFSIITALLQFITFGFSASRFNHSQCLDPFRGYSFGASLVLALLFTAIIVMNIIHRNRPSSVGHDPS